MGVFGDLEVWNPDNIGSDENPDFNNRLVVAGDRPFSWEFWIHVVFSYTNLGGEDSKADFYVNGKLQGTQQDISEPITWNQDESKNLYGVELCGINGRGGDL